MAEDKENITPIIPPMESDPDLKEYRCSHCGKFLFKGNVIRLNMVCHHYQKMIDVDASELIRPAESDD